MKTGPVDQNMSGINRLKETIEINEMPAMMTGHYELCVLDER